MASSLGQNGPSRPARSRRRGLGWTIRITPAGFLLLAFTNLVLLGALAYGISRLLPRLNLAGQTNDPTTIHTAFALATNSLTPPTSSPTRLPSATPSIEPSRTVTPEPPTASPQPISTLSLNQGLLILAIDEGGNTHLFAYQPAASGNGQPLPLTRLTYGPWDDITPAISPDGHSIAFASNRSGYWDIYLLDLGSGGIRRLTDTLTYDASPTWSPDNQWLAYETYSGNNLDIKIQSIQTPEDTIQLTNSPAADFSPVWSPRGRQIAFVSNQSGEDEIWLADLDKSQDQRFQNISLDPESGDIHPAWSPDGSSLLWVTERDGVRSLCLQKLSTSDQGNLVATASNRKNLGSGDWPAWSADGQTVLTLLQAPNHTYLTAYPVQYPGITLPTIELPGAVNGLSWGNSALTPGIPTIFSQIAQATPTPLYLAGMMTAPTENGGRYQLTPLMGVDAPHPFLHDLIEESFVALKSYIANLVGWDFLASLENAYVPLSAPLDPGMGDDWLYTGRAFAVNPLAMDAGWMVVVREDFGPETYWRVYIRALYQDGSAGIPLHDLPWDFDARNNGDTIIYEKGGAEQASLPPGYWIDFTERALSFGWERVPALVTWRAFTPAARFNEFASTGEMDWHTAMLELYPPEALITPTAVIPPSRTPTPTLRWYVSPTPTRTPTPRPTHTPGATPFSNQAFSWIPVAQASSQPGG